MKEDECEFFEIKGAHIKDVDQIRAFNYWATILDRHDRPYVGMGEPYAGMGEPMPISSMCLRNFCEDYDETWEVYEYLLTIDITACTNRAKLRADERKALEKKQKMDAQKPKPKAGRR